MRILIDIGHPAHVHYYRNFIKIMEGKGHEFFIIARNRSVIFSLLDNYGISYISRGKGKKSIFGKTFYAIYSIGFILFYALKFKPDLLLSQGGMYTSPVAWLVGVPGLSTEDTENATMSHKISGLFKAYFLSPSCFDKDLGQRHIKFDSYQELFYLHPNYFVPDNSVLKDLGVKKNERYVIVRFVDWNAHHDVGHKGISNENKIIAVNSFLEYAKVFILSECALPKELQEYQIKISPEKMHDAMYFAEMLFGESSTMASECACLGTPAFFIDDEGRGYTDEEEEKYGLVFNYTESLEDQGKAIDMAISLLEQKSLKDDWQPKYLNMLKDKIDVTRFFVWYTEAFPNSHEILKSQPEVQLKFK